MLGFLSRLLSPSKARCAPQSCLDVIAGWLGIARLGRTPPAASGKRRHRRWFLGRALVIEVNGKSLQGETVDISAAGAGLLLRTPLPVGTCVRLRDPDGTIGVPARVVHNALTADNAHFRVGVEFLLGEAGASSNQPGAATGSEASPPPLASPPAAGPAPVVNEAPPSPAPDVHEPAIPSPDELPSTISSPADPAADVPPPAAPASAAPAPTTPTPAGPAEQPVEAMPPTESSVPPSERWWVPRGRPVLEMSAPASAAPLSRDLIEFVERVIRHAELHLPMLPQVVQRALVMAQSEDVDFNRLATVLEADAALTASILRRANSAESAPVDRITRLPDALARLGRRKVLAVVAAAATKRVTLEATGLDPRRALQIWHTSAAAAAVMHVAARHFGLPADEAALIGLLHDLGVLAALRIAQLYRESYDPRLSSDTVDRLCVEWHEPLGRALAAAWQFQPPLPELCGAHHAASEPGDELARYRSLVQFTDVVCALLEYAPYVPYDFFRVPCVAALGITDEPEWHAWLAALPAAVAERMGDLT